LQKRFGNRRTWLRPRNGPQFRRHLSGTVLRRRHIPQGNRSVVMNLWLDLGATLDRGDGLCHCRRQQPIHGKKCAGDQRRGTPSARLHNSGQPSCRSSVKVLGSERRGGRRAHDTGQATISHKDLSEFTFQVLCCSDSVFRLVQYQGRKRWKLPGRYPCTDSSGRIQNAQFR
jgi:hypothetical protein